MIRLFNRKSQTQLRKKLRNEPGKPEQKLWVHLRNKQFHGLKFRRQYGIGSFVVDFCCLDKKLVIEIDGDSHFGDEEEASDLRRTEFIKGLGFRVIRFSNPDVMQNMEGVLGELGGAIDLP